MTSSELTINYHTPARLWTSRRACWRSSHGIEAADARCARPVSRAAAFRRTTPDSLAAAAAEAARDQADRVSEGTIAVISPRVHAQAIADVLGVRIGDAHDLLDATVGVFTPDDVRGLEFDIVVVVEPAAIVEETGGLGALYVALTRPTQRLIVLHSESLPTALRPAEGQRRP